MTESNVKSTEVHEGKDGQFYWCGKAGNGEILFNSEGYTRVDSAIEASKKAFPSITPLVKHKT